MLAIESLGLILMAAAVLFWLESVRARDLAVEAAREACQERGLQFLDDTATQGRLRFARSEEGRLCLERTFLFEFSDTGYDRHEGRVTLNCGRVESVYTGPVLLRDVN